MQNSLMADWSIAGQKPAQNPKKISSLKNKLNAALKRETMCYHKIALDLIEATKTQPNITINAQGARKKTLQSAISLFESYDITVTLIS